MKKNISTPSTTFGDTRIPPSPPAPGVPAVAVADLIRFAKLATETTDNLPVRGNDIKRAQAWEILTGCIAGVISRDYGDAAGDEFASATCHRAPEHRGYCVCDQCMAKAAEQKQNASCVERAAEGAEEIAAPSLASTGGDSALPRCRVAYCLNRTDAGVCSVCVSDGWQLEGDNLQHVRVDRAMHVGEEIPEGHIVCKKCSAIAPFVGSYISGGDVFCAGCVGFAAGVADTINEAREQGLL